MVGWGWPCCFPPCRASLPGTKLLLAAALEYFCVKRLLVQLAGAGSCTLFPFSLVSGGSQCPLRGWSKN